MISEPLDKKVIKYLSPLRVEDMALLPGIVITLHSMGRTIYLESIYDHRFNTIETIAVYSIPIEQK